MNVDYIVVGLGLAGLAFCRELEKNNKSFLVFENSSQHASFVAGGVYNPVILKRFSMVWDAEDQLNKAIPFYDELEVLLQKKYRYSLNIHRLFKSVEEQNNWTSTSDRPLFDRYMDPEIYFDKTPHIANDFGFGKMRNTGRIDTVNLLTDYSAYLKQGDRIRYQEFEYDELTISDNGLLYKEINAKKIVFCEGFGIKNNPYFKRLPLHGTKGELLEIETNDLFIDFMIKAAVFVLPINSNNFKVGATFNWKDKTMLPTDQGKNELVVKLASFYTGKYRIKKHLAGIRPTVHDRRPLVGCHTEFKNLGVLNGLGTRGVMIAPKAAFLLFQHMERQQRIPLDYAIQRLF